MPSEPAIETRLAAKANLRIPAHVGVIMDGNGRWAKARGKPRTVPHEKILRQHGNCRPACCFCFVGVDGIRNNVQDTQQCFESLLRRMRGSRGCKFALQRIEIHRKVRAVFNKKLVNGGNCVLVRSVLHSIQIGEYAFVRYGFPEEGVEVGQYFCRLLMRGAQRSNLRR